MRVSRCDFAIFTLATPLPFLARIAHSDQGEQATIEKLWVFADVASFQAF